MGRTMSESAKPKRYFSVKVEIDRKSNGLNDFIKKGMVPGVNGDWNGRSRGDAVYFEFAVAAESRDHAIDVVREAGVRDSLDIKEIDKQRFLHLVGTLDRGKAIPQKFRLLVDLVSEQK